MLRIQSQNSHHPQTQGMAGKKGRNRNVVTLPVEGMEVRGISSRNESHAIPLPERAEEALPFPFIHTVSKAFDSFLTPSVSDESLSDGGDQQNILVLSNNGWTTGNSTERSSLFSWADDEFDKAAAKRVQLMFDEIDSMLYEGQKNSSSSSQLQNECKVWKSRFPHLRILGSQLVPPTDDGFQLYPQEESPRAGTTGVLLDIADHEVPGRSTHDTHGLTLAGQHIHPITSTDSPFSSDISITEHVSSLEEEVFESDGVVEEFFAYDHCRIGDDESHEKKKYHAPRRREGFPPLTPNACVQNTVLSQAFDLLWTEIVGWMRTLVNRHLEDKEKALVSTQVSERSHQSNLGLPTFQPNFGLPISPGAYGGTGARLIEPPGKLAPMGSFRVGTSGPFNWQSPKPNALTGVMTISSKALHTRQGEKDRIPSSLMEESPSLQTNFARPTSSNLGITKLNNRPASTSTRLSDVAHGHRLSSARGGKSRLRPLERVKTPNLQSMDGMITGKKIMTANDRLNSPPHPMAASPPHQWSRNTMLPPIEAGQEHQLQRDAHRPPTSSKREPNRFRISSAIIDDRGQRPSKQVVPFIYNDSRPNTTHSFRSDNMLARRSSTPQGLASLFRPNAVSTPAPGQQGNDLGGITGIKVGIQGALSHVDTHVNSHINPHVNNNSQYGSQPSYLKTL